MCPAFTISKSKRNLFSIKTSNPGPGMYTTESFVNLTHKIKENIIYTNSKENMRKVNQFQKDHKVSEKVKNGPGPGTYNVMNSDFENNISKKLNSTFSKAGMSKKEEK